MSETREPRHGVVGVRWHPEWWKPENIEAFATDVVLPFVPYIAPEDRMTSGPDRRGATIASVRDCTGLTDTPVRKGIEWLIGNGHVERTGRGDVHDPYRHFRAAPSPPIDPPR